MTFDNFRVAGWNDEGMDATEPVQVQCKTCYEKSPFFTFRNDGGADYTTDLQTLVTWAQDHICCP